MCIRDRGHTALRLRALLPGYGLSRDIRESAHIQCTQLHFRMSSGFQPGVVRFGSRCAIGHRRLRSEPCRLVVYPRRCDFGHGTDSARLPGTAHFPLSVAADGVCAGRRVVALHVPGARRTAATEGIGRRHQSNEAGYPINWYISAVAMRRWPSALGCRRSVCSWWK